MAGRRHSRQVNRSPLLLVLKPGQLCQRSQGGEIHNMNYVQMVPGRGLRNVEGNSRLTELVGSILLVLLAVEGFTVIFITQMVVLHIVIGLILVPVIALKLGSVFYRFGRYYTEDPDYVAKGPPPLLLRLLGPLVVLSTFGVMITGVALLFTGPEHFFLLQLHQVMFIGWFAVMAMHVLGHWRQVPDAIATEVRAMSGTARSFRDPGGGLTRTFTVAAALVFGCVLVTLLLPFSASWQTFFSSL